MSSKQEIDLKELATYLAEIEYKKTCSELATELYQSRGKDFCVGLIIHLTMFVSGSYQK